MLSYIPVLKYATLHGDTKHEDPKSCNGRYRRMNIVVVQPLLHEEPLDDDPGLICPQVLFQSAIYPYCFECWARCILVRLEGWAKSAIL